ncbi:hypothetical protein HanRHA438_Chr15g0726071 [Helianthus annuus]|nr:hypothetical protein HanIR_Chr15g0776661 [Helianthus annuus]KAJ0846544.1 hypothetical protein HanRHA438_Chr15g0726071 [Helianthus annuus]
MQFNRFLRGNMQKTLILMTRRCADAEDIELAKSLANRVVLGFPNEGPQTWGKIRTTFYERVGENIRERELILGRFMHLCLKCSNFERCYVTVLNRREDLTENVALAKV